MPERRSGVDLVCHGDGWAVVFDHKILSVHAERDEAIAVARVHSKRLLSRRIVFGQTSPLARLLGDRRRARGGVPD